MLIEAEGTTVPRSSIEARIWPNQYVSYASIARCVYSLRKILYSNDYGYIQAVPKTGYRLGVPVVRSTDTSIEPVTLKVARGSPLALANFREGQR